MKYLKTGMVVMLVSLIIVGGRSFAQQEEEDSPYQNPQDVLTDFFNGAITIDDSLGALRKVYEQQQLLEQFQQNQEQVRAILSTVQNLNVELTSQQIQQIANILTNFIQGNIDINQVNQQLTQLLGKPVQVEVPDQHRTGTPVGEAKKKAAKEKAKKAAEKSSPPRDPVIHGTVKGVKEINGKTYLEIEAKGVDICDGNGMQKANGETWLVEVDPATAAQYKNKTGQDIYVAGDIQPDVDGKLTIKMNKNYGGGIVSADYYKQAWYKQNVDYMTRSYWEYIQERYGDSLSYAQKLDLLKKMLYPQTTLGKNLDSFMRR